MVDADCLSSNARACVRQFRTRFRVPLNVLDLQIGIHPTYQGLWDTWVMDTLDNNKRGHLWQIVRTGLSKAGLDRTYFKIFAIGFNKTGTTSLDTLFKTLGFFESYHGVDWRRKNAHLMHWRTRAFSDGRPDDFKLLDRRYPRSKFILNTRDPLEWLDSRYEHIKLKEQRVGRRVGDRSWQATPDAVESWIQDRNQHHLEVLSYFGNRHRDLLLVNFIRDADAADRIAAFLNRPGNYSKPYTRSTATKRVQGKLKNRDTIETALNNLGVPQSEWSLDLYFPSLNPEASFPADTSQINSTTD